MWNEPNIEPQSYETVKMLLGGDTLSVNKKYEDYVETALLSHVRLVVGIKLSWHNVLCL